MSKKRGRKGPSTGLIFSVTVLFFALLSVFAYFGLRALLAGERYAALLAGGVGLLVVVLGVGVALLLRGLCQRLNDVSDSIVSMGQVVVGISKAVQERLPLEAAQPSLAQTSLPVLEAPLPRADVPASPAAQGARPGPADARAAGEAQAAQDSAPHAVPKPPVEEPVQAPKARDVPDIDPDELPEL